ncbi:MAG: NifB/NifX family molybdenum-iron cluster-binding protein [Candidatus Cloacimonadaceae bacterium]|jgi:predicted Fe-Mo cluster-binding NifX family protein
MKIAVTAKGGSWDSLVDARFGRADYLVFFTEGSDELEVIDNRDIQDVAHGAGPKTAQLLHDKAPDVLITGNGPGDNATAILKHLNIELYLGAADLTIREAYQAYKDNKLKKKELAMPKLDGTGPLGDGRPGRGLGPCGQEGHPEAGFREGRRGMGRGLGPCGRGEQHRHGHGCRGHHHHGPGYGHGRRHCCCHPHHHHGYHHQTTDIYPYDKESLQARKKELEERIAWIDNQLKQE